MTVLEEMGIYLSINPRSSGLPDVFIIASDQHTDWYRERTNECIDKLFPHGTNVWIEGELENQKEITNKLHKISGWDDPDHCTQIRQNASDIEKVNRLSLDHFVSRQERLISFTSDFKEGDVVLMGSAHAILPHSQKSEIWPNNTECVKKLHSKLKASKLWVVILRCDTKSETIFKPKVEASESKENLSSLFYSILPSFILTKS